MSVIGTIAYIGGLPCVLQEFAWAWGGMVAYTSRMENTTHGGSYRYDRSTHGEIHDQRNYLAANAFGDWLLQIDTDHTFGGDLVAQMQALLDKHNLDVLSATYRQRRPEFHVRAWSRDGVLLDLRDGWEHEELVEIGSAGAGCLMVRTNVFRRIRERFGVQPFDIEPGLSEDHSFFHRCRRLGIRCWLAPRIPVDHLMVAPVTKAVADAQNRRTGLGPPA